MKKSTLWVAGIAVTLAICVPAAAAAYYLDSSTITVTTTQVASTTPELSSEQKAFLGALAWCESMGRPTAVNPKDSDGTPSYGLYQFKPGTYAEFAKLYHLASTTDYMNGDEQMQIVTGMILHNVNLHGQFPACTTKLGLPPKTPIVSDVDR